MSWHQKICPISLKWILNYRLSIVSENFSLKNMIKKDNHNRESFIWIKKQSELIDYNGWDFWLLSQNSRGFYAINKNKTINQYDPTLQEFK